MQLKDNNNLYKTTKISLIILWIIVIIVGYYKKVYHTEKTYQIMFYISLFLILIFSGIKKTWGNILLIVYSLVLLILMLIFL